MTRRTTSARERADKWVNLLTAIGNSLRDKTQAATFVLENLSEAEAEDLWRGDDMGAKIVCSPVEEMFRQGYLLKIGGEVRDREGIERAMTSRLADLQVNPLFKMAMEYRRAYGGGAIFIGADDGQADLDKPLNLEAVRSVRYLTIFRPRELIPATWYKNPALPKYGMPQTFYMVPDTETTSSLTRAELRGFTKIHESRFVIFRGVIVSRRHLRQNNGWGDSVFVRLLNLLAQFHQIWGGSAHLLSDFSQAVLKIKGLAELLSGNKRDKVMDRAAAIDMSRSVARAVILDSEEEWIRQPTPMAGYPDMIDRWMYRLASAVDMPASRLFGQSPAGLNATGDSDIRWYYDRTASQQDEILRPALEFLIRVLFRAKDGVTKGIEPVTWGIKFNSLWQLSAKEQAERNKLQAEADEKYYGMGLSSEEILQSRFGGEEYSLDTKLDLEGRDAMARAIKTREATSEGEQDPAQRGELLTPTDIATIVTVNQALEWLGFPPKQGPDGELTVSQYQAKNAPVIAAATASTSGETAPAAPAQAPPSFDRTDAAVTFMRSAALQAFIRAEIAGRGQT